MKKILIFTLLTVCLAQSFASEGSIQPLPFIGKTFIIGTKALTVTNDVPIWEPGTLIPDHPPVAFLASGYKVTVYTVFTEPQLYDAMDYIALYNNDWYTINMYLYSEFDGYYEIGMP